MTKDYTLEGGKRSFDSSKRRPTHICELPRGSDSNLLKLQPTASLRARLKRVFQKTIIVTKKHPATRFYLRSHAAITFEKKRHGRSPNWWVIHPCSALSFLWEIVMTMTYLYCFVCIPYIFAFYMLNTTSFHDKEFILIPAYAICLVGICMNFITGYTSSNSHEIFLDPGLIASRYAREYFLIDLLTSLPYSWVLQDHHTVPNGENFNFAAILIELLPMLKLLRLHTLYMSLKQYMQILGIGNIGSQVIWLSLVSVLFCHWAACFSYGFPFIVMHATKSSIEDSDTWFMHLPDVDDPVHNAFTLYLYSFYSGLTGLCAVDSNIVADAKDTSKNSAGDKFVTCLLLVCGVMYQTYLIIVILLLVESEKAPIIRYQQMRNNLKYYMSKKQTPPKLEKKLLRYYEYKFQDRYFKENLIFGSLADHLRDVILTHNCRKLIDNVTLFWNLPKPQLMGIITALKPEIFMPNDIIFKGDDEGSCMYFIGSGTIAMITFAGNEICHLEDGAYFGESALLCPGFRRPVTIIAVEECELFRFDRKDFRRVIPINCDLHLRMKKAVRDQVSILLRIEDEELQIAAESMSHLIDNNSEDKHTSRADDELEDDEGSRQKSSSSKK